MTAPRQLGLFDQRPPRAHDRTATSKAEADRRAGSGELAEIERRIVLWILTHGRATRRELTNALGVDISSMCWAVDRLLPKRGNAWLWEPGPTHKSGKLLDINPAKRELAERMAR